VLVGAFFFEGLQLSAHGLGPLDLLDDWLARPVVAQILEVVLEGLHRLRIIRVMEVRSLHILLMKVEVALVALELLGSRSRSGPGDCHLVGRVDAGSHGVRRETLGVDLVSQEHLAHAFRGRMLVHRLNEALVLRQVLKGSESLSLEGK